jgi:hypothetical protein
MLPFSPLTWLTKNIILIMIIRNDEERQSDELFTFDFYTLKPIFIYGLIDI